MRPVGRAGLHATRGGRALKAALTLTDGQRNRLDKLSEPRLLYPYWHQAKTATDRLSRADLSLVGPHLAGSQEP